MLSKAVFKQTLSQNWKLWVILTAVTSVIAVMIIRTFDPHAMRLAMMTFGADGPPQGMGGGPFGTGTSRFGMLTIPELMASGYYAMLGLLMPLVYVIITANSLIASQIDRGSMAYTLSAPITRIKLVFTQAAYLFAALAAMFAVVTVAGLATSQISHNALWGQAYTPDVVAAAQVLGVSNQDVENNLPLILNSPKAIVAGADARGVSQEVYTMYVELLLINQAIDGTAEIMGVTPYEFMENPAMADGNREVAQLFSMLLGVDIGVVESHMEHIVDDLYGQSIESPTMLLILMNELDHYMQDIDMDALMAANHAAAEYLGMESLELMANLHILANDQSALAVASEASGIDEATLLAFINVQLAEAEFEFDQGIYFNLGNFVNLNIGIFLLMFAVGGVSFMFSCIFNLTRNSLAFGAGIPIGFFILNMMANISPDFANFRFFTLNTLYNPANVAGGYGFIPQFMAMLVIGVALYLIGIIVFKRKDLPL
ncbi:MAG: hypothetical protein FWE21_05425 [Defluviitaleaceae bacterium]|nr:hypothetical protein [Defluviitaleaceae bacterium]